MRTFYIVTNLGKEKARETAAEIAGYLHAKGAKCLPQPQGSFRDGGYTDASQVPKDTECVITVGGDGTLIQAARDLAGCGIPFIGVNRGHLGYLTQVNDSQEVKEMLDALLEDHYRLESRMMLSGQVVRKGKNIFQDIALNEIVLSRKDTLKPLHFRILVNGVFLNDYTADGMIFATPTGSTAYNLSAGGPVVAPGARMMILTPICSHALNARSIVLPEEDQITVEILDEGHMAAFDGNLADPVRQGDRIQIRRSRLDTVLVQLRQVSFLQNLSSKMAGV